MKSFSGRQADVSRLSQRHCGEDLLPALSPEDNNSSQVGRPATSPRRGDVVRFHYEHSATFLSNQLMLDSIDDRSNIHCHNLSQQFRLAENVRSPCLL
jgi:hypothetical protein